MARAARQRHDSTSASPLSTRARYISVSSSPSLDSKQQLISRLRGADPTLATRLEEVITLLAALREAEARVLALSRK